MLVLDASTEEARAADWTARGKWYTFWAVVALGGSRGAGPDEVFRHAPWSSGTWASVGKEAW